MGPPTSLKPSAKSGANDPIHFSMYIHCMWFCYEIINWIEIESFSKPQKRRPWYGLWRGQRTMRDVWRSSTTASGAPSATTPGTWPMPRWPALSLGSALPWTLSNQQGLAGVPAPSTWTACRVSVQSWPFSRVPTTGWECTTATTERMQASDVAVSKDKLLIFFYFYFYGNTHQRLFTHLDEGKA